MAPEIQFLQTPKNFSWPEYIFLKLWNTLSRNAKISVIKDRDKKVDCTFSSSSPNISSQYLAILYCCGRLKTISIYFLYISNVLPIYSQNSSNIFPLHCVILLILLRTTENYFQYVSSMFPINFRYTLNIFRCTSWQFYYGRLKTISHKSRYIPPVNFLHFDKHIATFSFSWSLPTIYTLHWIQ